MKLLLYFVLNIFVLVSNAFDVASLEQKLTQGSKNISEDCLSALFNLTAVAQYVDASALLPSAVSSYNFFNLGDFDLCYSIEQNVKNKIVYGKYCLTTLNYTVFAANNRMSPSTRNFLEAISPSPRMIGEDAGSVGFHFGICIPHVCTAQDAEILQLFPSIISEDNCQSRATEPKYSTGAVVTLIFFTFIGALALLSTIYDIVLYYSNKESTGILLAFSILTNGKKLFQSSKNSDQLLCLNGIRAISMAWVILGHSFSVLLSVPLSNFKDTFRFIKTKENMWLFAAPLSVDTFFTVGGLVTMYAFLRARDKGTGFNIPLYYVHRYLRLTPALIAIILVNANLITYWGNGPLWHNVELGLKTPCTDYWWSTILYIQNYVNPGKNCLGQSWYLSADMQMFWISPLLLLLMEKYEKVAIFTFVVLIIAGCCIPFAISYAYELPALMTSTDISKQQDYNKLYYVQPYARYGPYLIGMFFGFFIYQLKKANKYPLKTAKNIKISFGIWIFAVTGLVACLYSGATFLGAEYDLLGESMYNGFHRNGWAVCLCIVIVLCVTGFGGPVDSFLSIPLFQIITKLSYSMYLVHVTFITARWASYRVTVHFSIFSTLHLYWGDFIYILALAFILCLVFESPIIILEKYIFGSENHKNKKAKLVEDKQ